MMNFFVTSEPIGDGGNLGGLAGADAHCQLLATAAGAGNRTWHAYLSTQARPGQPAVNARDRIGKGPWYNFKGEMIAQDLAHLHGDTMELAHQGNNLNKLTGSDRKRPDHPGFVRLFRSARQRLELRQKHSVFHSARDAHRYADRWHRVHRWSRSHLR